MLLCAQCHSEAPNVNDPEFMWAWLRAHAADFYGAYWYLRGFREYELVFGVKPFLGLDSADFLPKVRDVISEYFKDTSTHWGQGKMNPATLAWLIRQVEIEVQQNY